MNNGVESVQTSWGNADIAWDDWPVETYLGENYRTMHACDEAVVEHHSRFYRQFERGSITRSIEVGAGPNLYPLMMMAAASRSISAIDPSATNVAYVRDQIAHGADDSWLPFYARCLALNPALPPTLEQAIANVAIELGSVSEIPPDQYDLASMNFVAESVSERRSEVADFCLSFVRSVRVGGWLVASFMENQSRYRLGNGSEWPGYPIDSDEVERIFSPHVDELVIERIDADPALPDYYGGYTGMIMMTARRTA